MRMAHATLKFIYEQLKKAATPSLFTDESKKSIVELTRDKMSEELYGLFKQQIIEEFCVENDLDLLDYEQ